MTKFEKVKKIFTEFALNRNDARVSIIVNEDRTACNQISIKIECKFSKYLGNLSYGILFTASKRYPSEGTLNMMNGIDYVIKDLYVRELSVKALENLINSILNAAVWEIEAKLKTEESLRQQKS